MATEGRIRVLEGFYRWLEGGGRAVLSRMSKNREKRKRWKPMIKKDPKTANNSSFLN